MSPFICTLLSYCRTSKETTKTMLHSCLFLPLIHWWWCLPCHPVTMDWSYSGGRLEARSVLIVLQLYAAEEFLTWGHNWLEQFCREHGLHCHCQQADQYPAADHTWTMHQNIDIWLVKNNQMHLSDVMQNTIILTNVTYHLDYKHLTLWKQFFNCRIFHSSVKILSSKFWWK